MAGSVHDTYAKAVFSRPENANGLFRAVLPPELLSVLQLSSSEWIPGSYAGVKSRHTDLLYRIQLADREAFLYVLLEHKSSVDPLLPVTLLVYIGRIWDAWLRKNEALEPRKRAARAPAVIPLVLYHGPRGWSAATELLDVIDLDPEALAALRAHLPSFRFLLDDLATRTDQDLRAREAGVLGRLALLLMRHLRDLRSDPASVLAFLRTVADLFGLLPDDDRVLCFWYILEVVEPDPQAVQDALRHVISPEALEDEMTAAERLRAELMEGITTAGQRLRVEGQRRMFLKLLRSSFGQVPPELEQRVMAADEATLDAWVGRFGRAASIQEVLAPIEQ